MIGNSWFIKLFSVLTVTLSFEPLRAQDIFDNEHQLEYAKYVYSVGDYPAAAQEFCTVYHNQAAKDSICYFFLRSCIRSNNYSLALKTIATPDLVNKKPYIHIEYYKVLLLDNKYSLADSLVLNDSAISEQDRTIFLLYSALLSNRLQDAKRLISYCEANTITLPTAITTYKIRSAWQYAFASAIIPGLGKILYGRTADGLAAGTITILNGTVSYRAFLFRGYSNANVWVFGALALGFYAGNVYGTIKLVQTTPVFLSETIKQILQN